MSRRADTLRAETLAADLALTPGGRVERARQVLRRQRAAGRRPSRCAQGT